MTGLSRRELGHRAAAGLREFLALFLYLWICFGALVALKAAILNAHGVAYLPYGFAVLKALVSAKFLHVGHLLGVAKGRAGEPLIVAIARKSLALLVVLVALTVAEEAVIAAIDGHSVLATIHGLGGGTVWQMVMTIVVLLLILIPYVAYRAFGEALGEDELRRLLFERRRTPS